MAELHEALSHLKPIAWADLPVSSTAELKAYTQGILDKARLIMETVPEQNPSSASLSDVGTSAASATKSGLPNGTMSQSRLNELQKEWGKPIKMNNAKENPLNIPIFKLAGKDGKGVWFARRSVHKGLSFRRWKEKMIVEMEESLKVRQKEMEEGQTPEFCIRSIGVDRRLERVLVRQQLQSDDSNLSDGADEVKNGEVMATIQVYHQSAQFPGPTSARDFVTMLIMSDSNESNGPDDNSALPPTCLIVSKPCDHPDAPTQRDYIRGQYESIELIRELPIEHSMKTQSEGQPPNSHTTKNIGTPIEKSTSDISNNSGNSSPNPVEWIMITRSDPGGSVPRWMVERGTPKSITADAVKFLNWASKFDASEDEVETTRNAGNEPPKNDDGDSYTQEGVMIADQQPDAVETERKATNQSLDGADSLAYNSNTHNNVENKQIEDGNMWSNVSKMVQSGLQEYTPKTVLNYIPGSMSPSPGEDNEGSRSRSATNTTNERNARPGTSEHDDELGETGGIDEETDTSSLASDDTFASAVMGHPTHNQLYFEDQPSHSTSAMNSETALNTSAISDAATKRKLSSKEKELAKLTDRKHEVEAKLATIRNGIREVGGTASKSTSSTATKAETSIVRGSTRSGEFSLNDYRIADASGRSSTSTPITADTSTSTTAAAEHIATVSQKQKRIGHLVREESKLVSRLTKIERQQLKVAKKLEVDQRKATAKAAGRAEKNRTRSEMESLRSEVNSLRLEVLELRGERQKWLDIIVRLQKENTAFAQQVSKSSVKES